MKLTADSLKDKSLWEGKGYRLPQFDISQMIEKTQKKNRWLHFGAGNIFRIFPALLQQSLLNDKKVETGIIVCETFDTEILDTAFTPYDNLTVAVTLKTSGDVGKEIVASVAETLGLNLPRLSEIFSSPELQMVSYTITEKGYSLKSRDGSYLKGVEADLNNFKNPVSLMGISAYMAYVRFKSGKLPLAFVSLDNHSHNGSVLKQALIDIANIWLKKGFVETEFLEYLNDEQTVSFPWSMIDKITPRPDKSVQTILQKDGLQHMDIIQTAKNSFSSAFVNAEEAQYLVIENLFPNGHPPLETVGVIFADRETIDKVEKMKVCTCLNPLHTALAIFGCLLGHATIAEAMKDAALLKLIKHIGYVEGLPMAVSPKVINPRAFMDEVINVRFPNPFIADRPQRIATDTSLKFPIRFGETLKAYLAKKPQEINGLQGIPLLFAAWGRYLLGQDDQGQAMEVSPDPRLGEVKAHINGMRLGNSSLPDSIKNIYSDPSIFGIDLYTTSLGNRVEACLSKMLKGSGAVRKVLNETVSKF